MQRKQHGSIILTAKINKFMRLISSALKVGILFGLLAAAVFVHFTYQYGLPGFWKLIRGWLDFKGIAGLFPIPRRLLGARELWQLDWDESLDYRLWVSLVFLSAGALAVFIRSQIQRRLGEKAAEGVAVRDGELKAVTPEELKAEIQAAVSDSRSDYAFTSHDLTLSDSKIIVPDKVSGLSWSISGASGTGKTLVLNQKMDQIRRAKGKAFVIDPNREFYKRHARKGDIILSLFEPDQVKWYFWTEVMDFTQMASGLIPVRDDMNPERRFWQGGARNLVASLLRHSRSLPELWQLCNLSLDELRAFLRDRNDPVAKLLGEDSKSKVGEGMQAIATQDLGLFLKYMGHHPHAREVQTGIEESTFSIRDWVMNDADDRWVFVVARDSDWEVTKPLIRLWTHIATYSLLERGEHPGRKRFWVFADEVSTVGEIPAMPLILDRGRKYKARIALGFQTFAQVVECYGEIGAKKILNGLQNRLIFGVTDPELADKYSMALSSQDIETQSVSQTVSDKDRANLSWQMSTRRIVSPGEILGLKERWAWLKLAGFNPTKVYFTYKDFPAVMDDPEYTPRPKRFWLEETPLQPYRSFRDRVRQDFLDRFKNSVDHVLKVAHSTGLADIGQLRDAISHCLRILGESSSLRDRIDGEVYELQLIAGKPPKLHVARGDTRLSLSISRAAEYPPDDPAAESGSVYDPADE